MVWLTCPTPSVAGHAFCMDRMAASSAKRNWLGVRGAPITRIEQGITAHVTTGNQIHRRKHWVAVVLDFKSERIKSCISQIALIAICRALHWAVRPMPEDHLEIPEQADTMETMSTGRPWHLVSPLFGP